MPAPGPGLSPRRPAYWALAAVLALGVGLAAALGQAAVLRDERAGDARQMTAALAAALPRQAAAGQFAVGHFDLDQARRRGSVWYGPASLLAERFAGFAGQAETREAREDGYGLGLRQAAGPFSLELVAVGREDLRPGAGADPWLVRVWLEYDDLGAYAAQAGLPAGAAVLAAAALAAAAWNWLRRRLLRSDQRAARSEQSGREIELGAQLARTAAQLHSLQLLLGSMNEGVIVCDTRGRITVINPCARALFGLDLLEDRQLIGAQLLERIHANDLWALFEAIVANHNPAEMELRLYHNPPLVLHVGASWINGQTAADQGVLFVLADITTLQRLEAVRTQFVANVSHELRTPVTALKGFAETLLEGDLADVETTRHFLGIIQRQAERLAAIIEDLLTLSRLEQAGGEIKREDCRLPELVEAALEVCRPKAQARQCAVAVAVPDLTVSANRHLIEQAVINLVDNAIKYGPEGTEIRIEGGRIDQPAGWRLSVSDNGPGIPLREQERLFERFYRIDQARSRNLGGTGLGLAIVRHIALAHGGSADLESTPGMGSTFSLVIPDQA